MAGCNGLAGLGELSGPWRRTNHYGGEHDGTFAWGAGRLSPATYHRGMAWKPSQGFHQQLTEDNALKV
jgi:hypothetical protein